MSVHILMARIFIRTVSSYVCTGRFCAAPPAVCGQRLSAFASVQQAADDAVSPVHYVPSTHVLLSSRRNYKTTRRLLHLTVEERFILRVSSTLFLQLFD